MIPLFHFALKILRDVFLTWVYFSPLSNLLFLNFTVLLKVLIYNRSDKNFFIIMKK